jgi:hypothetical protein
VDHFSRYAVYIDGRWSLEDLYRFPRAYEQVYFALEAIVSAEDEEIEERIVRAFRAFPWRGGYSAVSFYNQLKWATAPEHRPVIVSIQYASPGWIEMLLNQHLALQIGAVVTSVAGSIGVCNKVYNRIHTDLQKRNLLRIEVERKQIELSREKIGLVKDSVDDIVRILGLDAANTINDRTNDPLISLKILLSIYRRIRILAQYKLKGKIDFRSIEQMRRDHEDI